MTESYTYCYPKVFQAYGIFSYLVDCADVIIVVGTWPGAEIFDRQVANIISTLLLKNNIISVILTHTTLLRPSIHDLKIHRELHPLFDECFTFYEENFMFLCITDLFKRLIDSEKLFISIGNYYSNEFSKIISNKLKIDKNIYSGIVEYSPADKRLKKVKVLLLYGRDPLETRNIAIAFLKNNLKKIKQAIKNNNVKPEYCKINCEKIII